MQSKSIISVVLMGLMLTSFSTKAQLSYGIRTGLNYSAQASMGKLNDGDNFKPGFTIGAKANYQLNNILLVGAEVNYQQKGGELTMNLDDAFKSVTRKADYLNVPLLVTAQFGEQLSLNPNWKTYITAGPYYGWLLNVSDTYNGNEVSDKTGIENTAADTDWGLVYGLGASYNFGQFAVYGEFRYDMGFAEVASYDTDLRNKSLGLTVGINF